MNREILTSILRAPFDIDFRYEGDLVYRGINADIPGSGTVRATPEAIEAELTESESALMKAAASSPGVEVPFGLGLRDLQPGMITSTEARGTIVPPDDSWQARDAIQNRVRWSSEDFRSTYNFVVKSLLVRGSASKGEITLRRHTYRGSHIAFEGNCLGSHIVAESPSGKQTSREMETLSVCVTPPFSTALQDEALWVGLSLMTGNRLQQLAIEDYDDDGNLISRTIRLGNHISEGRNEPFHSHLAPLTNEGASAILSGVNRLLSEGFPIGVAVHHLTDSNTGNIDTDATHLVLSLHCCLEAWNRLFGFDEWIDDQLWERFAVLVRHNMFKPTFYDDLGEEMKANLASALRHANRTTTSWRQQRFFNALGFQLSADDKCALSVRDEILHNGYFLKRWFDLTPEERQQRRDNVARLRNLAMSSILILCGFEGDTIDHIRYGVLNIEKAALPNSIAQ